MAKAADFTPVRGDCPTVDDIAYPFSRGFSLNGAEGGKAVEEPSKAVPDRLTATGREALAANAAESDKAAKAAAEIRKLNSEIAELMLKKDLAAASLRFASKSAVRSVKAFSPDVVRKAVESFARDGLGGKDARSFVLAVRKAFFNDFDQAFRNVVCVGISKTWFDSDETVNLTFRPKTGHDFQIGIPLQPGFSMSYVRRYSSGVSGFTVTCDEGSMRSTYCFSYDLAVVRRDIAELAAHGFDPQFRIAQREKARLQKEMREEAEMYPADRYWRIEMRDEDGYSTRQYVPKTYDEYFD